MQGTPNRFCKTAEVFINVHILTVKCLFLQIAIFLVAFIGGVHGPSTAAGACLRAAGRKLSCCDMELKKKDPMQAAFKRRLSQIHLSTICHLRPTPGWVSPYSSPRHGGWGVPQWAAVLTSASRVRRAEYHTRDGDPSPQRHPPYIVTSIFSHLG